MLVERVLRTPAYDALLQSVAAPRAANQARALACLRYLHTAAPVAVAFEQQGQAVYALVAFLASRNALAARRPHVPDTDWRHRSRAEKDALAALACLAPPRLSVVVHAGAVSKWLALYPFGGKDAHPVRRRQVVKRLCERQSDDADLAAILTCLMCSADARRQLRAAGLIGRVIDESKADGFDSGFGHGGSVARRGASWSAVTGGRRHANAGGEEAAVRRRRRQAMVYGEQGQPVTRDNIYEGEADEEPWDVEVESASEDDGEEFARFLAM